MMSTGIENSPPRFAALSKLRALIIGILAATVSIAGVSSRAQPVVTPEEVQAAYLHKFTGYVDWPTTALPSASSPMLIGVVGSERMYELLGALSRGRLVQGRPVEVRHLASTDQVSTVQLVFVGQQAWRELPAWASAAKGRAVLVATDAPHGVDHGATLGFVQSGNRVRFEASLPAAEQAGIKLSSRLLGVAERVVGLP
jgi:hypothetical protein